MTPIEKLEEQSELEEHRDEDIPPGATRVYRVLGSDQFHVDAGCTYLPPRMGSPLPTIYVYSLATALKWSFLYRSPCEYCCPAIEDLHDVVEQHDEYPGEVDLQRTIGTFL